MSPLITVQSGPRNARTDPESGLRFYTWEGLEYPSVTSVRNLAGMPFKLNIWRTNQVIDRAMTKYTDLGAMLARGGDPKAVASWLRKAADEKRDAAANLGTRVHDAAASGKTLAEVSADVAPFLAQYLHFLDHSGIEILVSERQVWNLTIGYAGTFDLIGRFKRTGKTFMIDLKTGTGTYPEHALQLEAYARGEFVGEDDKVDRKASAILAQVEGRAILHLRPEGWTFQTIDPAQYGRLWMSFTSLLDFAMWAHEFPTVDNLISHSLKGTATP